MDGTASLETIVAALTAIAAAVGLVRWSRFIARCHGAPRWIRHVGPVGVVAMSVGLLGTVLGLMHAFSAVSAPGLSAADRQRVLSNGIAEAMYNTAIGLGVAGLCVVLLLVLTWRYHWAAKDGETSTVSKK